MPFKVFKITKDIELHLYQGERGPKPHLDFKVKQLEKNKRPRTPSHTHWIMDLILKMEYDKKTTSDFIIFLQEIYDNSKPFKSLKERKEYNLKYLEKAKQKFSHINGGIYPIEYITALVELFSICEKQYPDAYMFKKSLDLAYRYSLGTCDFYTIVSHSKRV